MSDVQRYHMRAEIDDREGVEIWPVKDDTGRLVMWEDHEAALAAARDEGYEAGLRARWGEREDRAFNAALDAAIGTGLAVEDVNRVLDLRKTPPQPEALTREQQNERWRQDYNTQARLRKVDDWRLTEYPKPPRETPVAAQPEVAWVDGPEGPSC